MSPATIDPVNATEDLAGPFGITSTPVVSFVAVQIGALGHVFAKVSVHLPPFVPDPTVIRPAVSLPTMLGDVPQSEDPDPIDGATLAKVK